MNTDVKNNTGKLWLLIVTGGTEIDRAGPYDSEEERTEAAKKIINGDDAHFPLDLDSGDNLFQLTIDANGEPQVGSYMQGSLDETEEEK